MSDFCVILVFKISHSALAELLIIKNFECLELEHSESNTDITDKL